MNPTLVSAPWDAELAALLAELTAVQGELLSLLSEKGRRLAQPTPEGLASFEPQEQELLARLQRCHDRRAELLKRSADAGQPVQNLRELAGTLPGEAKRPLASQLDEAAARMRLLQHQSLANWVVVQRTLIHLSQLLEIIATGGRPQPTYGKESAANRGGALLDQAV